MTPRLAKQILYSAGYIIFFALIIFGVYYIWFQPAPSCFDNRQNQGETGVDCGGPCKPCALKNIMPLKTSWIKEFPVKNQTIITAEIQNPNIDFGAKKLTYTMNIYGKDGSVIQSVMRDSLIYAGEIKYILELTDASNTDIADVKIDFSNFDWQSKDDFPNPNIQIRAINTVAGANGLGPNVNGLISNNNPFGLSKARIIGFLVNSADIEISASQTELDNLNAFEEKPFQVNFHSDVSLVSNQSTSTQVFLFNRNLSLDSKNVDVSELQKLLKALGFLSGDITDYFGKATSKALTQYQIRSGISPANGSLGPKTRSYINAELQKQSIPQPNLSAADPAKTKIYVEAIR